MAEVNFLVKKGLTVPKGSASTPAIIFDASDPNTGIYSPAADQLAISTNGTGRLVIDANGNLLAGTGALGFSGKQLTLKSGQGYLGLAVSGTESTIFSSWDSSATPLLFTLGGTERMRLDSSGRLGLGTSTPGSYAANFAVVDSGSSAISIAAGTTSYSSLYFADGTSGTQTYAGFVQYSHADDKLYIGSGANNTITCDSSGRVGIGTTSPGQLCSIGGPSVTGTVGRLLSIYANSASGAGSGSELWLGWSSPSNAGGGITIGGVYNGSGTDILFSTPATFSSAPTEKVRIDSSGRLLVGTSSARSNVDGGNTPQVQIEGVGYPAATMSLTRNSADTGAPIFYFAKTRSASVGGNTAVQSGDTVGQLIWTGSDGTNTIKAAEIKAEVDGTPGANDMPGRLVFSTTADGASSPTERMRITSDAYVRLASGTGGIQFNGDTAAANALDDYEEGTWTVTFYDAASGGNASSTTATGYYTKVGDRISCNFAVSNIDTTGMTSGNTIYFSLPFTASASKSAHFGSVAVENINVNDATVNVTAHINASAARGYLLSSLDNAGFAGITVGSLASGAADVWGSAVYC